VFYAGEQLFWAYLSVVMSILMIMTRFIFVIVILKSLEDFKETSSYIPSSRENVELEDFGTDNSALSPFTDHLSGLYVDESP